MESGLEKWGDKNRLCASGDCLSAGDNDIGDRGAGDSGAGDSDNGADAERKCGGCDEGLGGVSVISRVGRIVGCGGA